MGGSGRKTLAVLFRNVLTDWWTTTTAFSHWLCCCFHTFIPSTFQAATRPDPFLITVHPAFRVEGGHWTVSQLTTLATSSTAIGTLFRVNFIASEPSARVYRSWEEARVPGEKPPGKPPPQWEYDLQPC